MSRRKRPRKPHRRHARGPRLRRRGAPVGAQPGAFVVPEGAPPPRIRVIAYDADGVEEHETARPGDLRRFLTGNRVCWIDVVGFGDEAILREVGELLELHPLALADVVNVPQRSKAERYGDRLLVITQVAFLEADATEMEQVSLVLGPGWVVTFQEKLGGDVFEPLRGRLRTRQTRLRGQGADYLAYTLLDAVVDGFFPVVEALGEKVDALETGVMEQPTRDRLEQIHAARRAILHLYHVQIRQRDAVASLLRGEEEALFSQEVRPYLRDVLDHASQTIDVLETYRDMCVGLLDIYLSAASHRMNDAMRTLTVVASVFIPLTFVAGIYGMNFEHMPELAWRWGYPAVLAGMAVAALALVAWFRRRGWLGGDE